MNCENIYTNYADRKVGRLIEDVLIGHKWTSDIAEELEPELQLLWETFCEGQKSETESIISQETLNGLTTQEEPGLFDDFGCEKTDGNFRVLKDKQQPQVTQQKTIEVHKIKEEVITEDEDDFREGTSIPADEVIKTTKKKNSKKDSIGKIKEKKTPTLVKIQAIEAKPAKAVFITCPQCPKKFKLRDIFEDHMVHDHSMVSNISRPYNCDICSKTFAQRKHILRHLRETHKHKPVSLANKKIANAPIKLEVTDEVNQMPPPKVVPSLICQPNTRTPSIRKKVHQCTICGKIYKRNWNLKGHIKTHDANFSYPCPEVGCELQFKTNGALQGHLRSHIYPMGKPFECTKCKKRFVLARSLENHLSKDCRIREERISMKTVRGEQKMEHAPQAYLQSAYNGKKTVDVKPLACSTCGKQYKTIYHLSQHEKQHMVTEIKVIFN